jgi:hypothetical protein
LDLHKPKPWHGVREFLKEYAIIVIGVLTALGAEQVVEVLHTRHIIAESEAAMRAELVDDNLPQAYVRAAVAPCLAAHLRKLRQAVAAGAPPGAFGALASSYNPPARIWDTDAWKAALSSVAGSRMDSARLLAWSQTYALVPRLQAVADEELQLRGRLNRTKYRSGPLTGARADELNDVIDGLEVANMGTARRAVGLILTAGGRGMAIAPAKRAGLLAEARRVYGACAVEPDLAALQQIGEQASSVEALQNADRALGVDRP